MELALVVEPIYEGAADAVAACVEGSHVWVERGGVPVPDLNPFGPKDGLRYVTGEIANRYEAFYWHGLREDRGIWVGAGDCTTFNNTIYDNGWYQAKVEPPGCNWDNGTVGNYWGDYETQNPTASRVGNVWDTPYVINGSSTSMDHYPLACPSRSNPPTWLEEPTNRQYGGGEVFVYQLHASDDFGIWEYKVNSSLFQVTAGGALTNATELPPGTYWLTASAFDGNNQRVDAVFSITVEAVEGDDGGDEGDRDQPGEAPEVPGYPAAALAVAFGLGLALRARRR